MLRRFLAQLLKAGARQGHGARPSSLARSVHPTERVPYGAVDREAAEALYRRGLEHAGRADYRQALLLFTDAAAALTDRADVADAAANSALMTGELHTAELWYRKAIELDRHRPARWANLGLCLRNQGKLGDADRAIEQALALDPDAGESRLTQALLHVDRGRFDDAENALRSLLSRCPDLAEAHTALSHVLLLQGRFPEGWLQYEWRHRLPGASTRAELDIPRWHGEPASDATLLITAEQGLGDQIMLCSCVPDVAARVASCWLEMDPRLAPMARRSFPSVRVLPYRRANDASWLERVGRPDLQIAMGSLPGIVRRSRMEFPTHAGYLKADPQRVHAWRERIAALGDGLRVGVSWRGGAPATRGALRSIALEELRCLFERPDVLWISLQYGVGDEELRRARGAAGNRLHFFSAAIADYEETAALVEAVDLVVSVQTAVAHLAGALGKPVWILLPVTPEWRYMSAGERLLWYPSARLFRQTANGDWKTPIAAVASALTCEVAGK